MSERRCAFVHSRHCYVEPDNIPLDVCQLCIEAWRIDRELTARETQFQNINQVQTSRLPQIQTSNPPTIQAQARTPDVEEQLKQLDQLFLSDSIDPQEYVKRRTNILNGAPGDVKVQEPNRASHIDAMMHNIRVMNVEKKLGKYKVEKLPGDWEQPEFMGNKFYAGIFNLMESLPNTQKVTLQIQNTKVAVLSYNETNMALLILDENESVETMRNEILKISPNFDVDKIDEALRTDKVKAKPLSKPIP
jgi:hypothetical protein